MKKKLTQTALGIGAILATTSATLPFISSCVGNKNDPVNDETVVTSKNSISKLISSSDSLLKNLSEKDVSLFTKEEAKELELQVASLLKVIDSPSFYSLSQTESSQLSLSYSNLNNLLINYNNLYKTSNYIKTLTNIFHGTYTNSLTGEVITSQQILFDKDATSFDNNAAMEIGGNDTSSLYTFEIIEEDKNTKTGRAVFAPKLNNLSTDSKRSWDLYVPDTIYDEETQITYDVVKVGDENSLFSYSPEQWAVLQNIYFGKNVLTIADSTFRSLSGDNNKNGLKTVTLNYNLEEIGSFAFFDCNKLEKITFPSKTNNLVPQLKIINESAFSNNFNLTEIENLNDCENLRIINKNAFFATPSIASASNINLSNFKSLYSIGDKAFYASSILNYGSKILIPSSVEKMGKDIFNTNEISAFEKIKIVDSNVTGLFLEVDGNRNNDLTNQKAYWLVSTIDNSSLDSSTSPKLDFSNTNIYGITESSFDLLTLNTDCNSKIILPNSLTYIGDKVFDKRFKNCDFILASNLHYNNSKIDYLYANSFDESIFFNNIGNSSSGFIYETNVEGIRYLNFNNGQKWCLGATYDAKLDTNIDVNIQQSTYGIADNAFELQNLSINQINLNNDLQYIGDNAFCVNYVKNDKIDPAKRSTINTSLITLPSSLKFIGDNAFNFNAIDYYYSNTLNFNFEININNFEPTLFAVEDSKQIHIGKYAFNSSSSYQNSLNLDISNDINNDIVLQNWINYFNNYQLLSNIYSENININNIKISIKEWNALSNSNLIATGNLNDTDDVIDLSIISSGNQSNSNKDNISKIIFNQIDEKLASNISGEINLTNGVSFNDSLCSLEYANSAFAKTSIKSIKSSSANSKITYKMFESCTNIESVDFTNFVSIDSYAFQNAKLPAELEISKTISYIGDYAFNNAGVETITLYSEKDFTTTLSSQIDKNYISLYAFDDTVNNGSKTIYTNTFLNPNLLTSYKNAFASNHKVLTIDPVNIPNQDIIADEYNVNFSYNDFISNTKIISSNNQTKESVYRYDISSLINYQNNDITGYTMAAKVKLNGVATTTVSLSTDFNIDDSMQTNKKAAYYIDFTLPSNISNLYNTYTIDLALYNPNVNVDEQNFYGAAATSTINLLLDTNDSKTTTISYTAEEFNSITGSSLDFVEDNGTNAQNSIEISYTTTKNELGKNKYTATINTISPFFIGDLNLKNISCNGVTYETTFASNALTLASNIFTLTFDGIDTIPDNLLKNNLAIKNIKLKNVNHIGDYAFANSGIKSIEIENDNNENSTKKYTSIGKSAFESCYALTSFDTEYIDFIDDNAFAHSSLISIDINDNINYLGSDIFKNCKSLIRINSFISDTEKLELFSGSAFDGLNEKTIIYTPSYLREEISNYYILHFGIDQNNLKIFEPENENKDNNFINDDQNNKIDTEIFIETLVNEKNFMYIDPKNQTRNIYRFDISYFKLNTNYDYTDFIIDITNFISDNNVISLFGFGSEFKNGSYSSNIYLSVDNAIKKSDIFNISFDLTLYSPNDKIKNTPIDSSTINMKKKNNIDFDKVYTTNTSNSKIKTEYQDKDLFLLSQIMTNQDSNYNNYIIDTLFDLGDLTSDQVLSINFLGIYDSNGKYYVDLLIDLKADLKINSENNIVDSFAMPIEITQIMYNETNNGLKTKLDLVFDYFDISKTERKTFISNLNIASKEFYSENFQDAWKNNSSCFNRQPNLYSYESFALCDLFASYSFYNTYFDLIVSSDKAFAKLAKELDDEIKNSTKGYIETLELINDSIISSSYIDNVNLSTEMQKFINEQERFLQQQQKELAKKTSEFIQEYSSKFKKELWDSMPEVVYNTFKNFNVDYKKVLLNTDEFNQTYTIGWIKKEKTSIASSIIPTGPSVIAGTITNNAGQIIQFEMRLVANGKWQYVNQISGGWVTGTKKYVLKHIIGEGIKSFTITKGGILGWITVGWASLAWWQKAAFVIGGSSLLIALVSGVAYAIVNNIINKKDYIGFKWDEFLNFNSSKKYNGTSEEFIKEYNNQTTNGTDLSQIYNFLNKYFELPKQGNDVITLDQFLILVKEVSIQKTNEGIFDGNITVNITLNETDDQGKKLSFIYVNGEENNSTSTASWTFKVCEQDLESDIIIRTTNQYEGESIDDFIKQFNKIKANNNNIEAIKFLRNYLYITAAAYADNNFLPRIDIFNDKEIYRIKDINIEKSQTNPGTSVNITFTLYDEFIFNQFDGNQIKISNVAIKWEKTYEYSDVSLNLTNIPLSLLKDLINNFDTYLDLKYQNENWDIQASQLFDVELFNANYTKNTIVLSVRPVRDSNAVFVYKDANGKEYYITSKNFIIDFVNKKINIYR